MNNFCGTITRSTQMCASILYTCATGMDIRPTWEYNYEPEDPYKGKTNEQLIELLIFWMGNGKYEHKEFIKVIDILIERV